MMDLGSASGYGNMGGGRGKTKTDVTSKRWNADRRHSPAPNNRQHSDYQFFRPAGRSIF